MTTYGKLTEFRQEEEEFSVYLEWVQLFFVANDIPEGKQVPIFLNALGSTTYGLLRSLLAPTNPKDKSFVQLAVVLQKHLEPKPNVIAECFKFHRCNQQQGELVGDYVAELRRLVSRCSFGDYLTEVLRDRLVCGLWSEST